MTPPKSKTTQDLFIEYIDAVHAAYEEVLTGKTATAEAREKLMTLGIELARAVGKDAADAEAWRVLKNGLNTAVAEAEFAKGSAKGRMN